VLIDFGPHAGRWDPRTLAGDLALFIRQPLVLRADSEEFLEALLRRYPGRPGVVGAEGRGALAVSAQALKACAVVGG
jgi:hypothetical protein